MVEILVLLLAALVVVAATTSLSTKIGVPAPLMQIAVGIIVGFLPFAPSIEFDPELVLMVILPPLLYSAAVGMPAMTFRREFTAISGLSVLLVIATTVGLGAFLAAVIPGLGFGWAVALAAVISPTDAVATTIVKRAGASKRVVAILEGESLLNDASALVLLRTAIASVAIGFSFWGTVGSFTWSVFSAVAIGALGGWLTLLIRSRVKDSAVDSVLSFVVPFAVALPVDLIGGSGLVAAVVAGIVHGYWAPRYLPALHRTTAAANWRTMSLILEAAVFLIMGLELRTITLSVADGEGGVRRVIIIAVIALAIVLLIRAAFVFGMLGILARRTARGQARAPRLDELDAQLASGTLAPRRGNPQRNEQWRARMQRRITQARADLAYFTEQQLTWRDGTIIVWAGMRGAVTVAAAQTIPTSAPHRDVLVLLAYSVAFLSLVLQGGTISAVARKLLENRPSTQLADEQKREKRNRAAVRELMKQAADDAKATGVKEPVAVIRAQRDAVLDARTAGFLEPESLDWALHRLDAREIAASLDDDD